MSTRLLIRFLKKIVEGEAHSVDLMKVGVAVQRKGLRQSPEQGTV